MDAADAGEVMENGRAGHAFGTPSGSRILDGCGCHGGAGQGCAGAWLGGRGGRIGRSVGLGNCNLKCANLEV
jgi:hypothetical protein